MVHGSCLCGGVIFEYGSTASSFFRLCHCHRCRKVTGSAFMAAFLVFGGRFTRGQELIRTFEAPILKFPPAYRKDFCARCGSPVPWPAPEPDLFVVPAGFLDDDPGIRPTEHVFVECAAPWHQFSDELPQRTEARLMYDWVAEHDDSGPESKQRYEFLLKHYAATEVEALVRDRLKQLSSYIT